MWKMNPRFRMTYFHFLSESDVFGFFSRWNIYFHNKHTVIDTSGAIWDKHKFQDAFEMAFV